MTTLLYSHPACENHIPDIGHPENPERLRAIARALSEKSSRNALLEAKTAHDLWATLHHSFKTEAIIKK